MKAYTEHKCLIAVPEDGPAILVKSAPSLMEGQIFDGCFLPDNITRTETIPTLWGIYQCVIKCEHTSSYDHYSGGTEYDADIWIENAVLVPKT